MTGGTRGSLVAGAVVALGIAAYFWLRADRAPTAVTTSSSASPASQDPPSTTNAVGPTSASPSAAVKNPDGSPVIDRARADAIRAQLKAIYAAPPPSETAENRPNPEIPVMPHDSEHNDVLKEYIHQRIKDDYVPLAKSCYENALAKSPKLGGKLVMSFRIVGDRRVGGVVESADIDPSSTLQDDDLSLCMKESMMSVSFDAPPDDKPVTVTYPIVLSPGDGGE